MLVKDAKAAARHWVIEEAGNVPGFVSAYFAGSSGWLPDDAVLPPTSDLDVNVVYDRQNTTTGRGKFLHRDVLLEVTSLPFDQVQSPDRVLGDYHLAGGFRTSNIILDPSEQLSKIQAAVARDYARRYWVRRRCEHAASRVREQLAALKESDLFHDQVLGWIFPTGVMTHVLLVAGLQNPTVRRRYVAVRELLEEYGHLPFHETLLELVGCAHMNRSRTEQHLNALAEVFDATTAVAKTPFSFSSDLSEIARPIAIDGTRELIEHGLHREAVFWIVVTYSRCQKALSVDAPAALQQAFAPGYRQLLGDLGITSFADLQQRAEQVNLHLVQVWEVAEGIMAVNPGIAE